MATAAWVLYDLANTIFALGVVGLYFPAWLEGSGYADSTLAVTEAAAGLVVVVAAPWVGALTDRRGRRVPALALTTVLAVAATAGLASLPGAGSFVLLGAALVGFNVGTALYDALLPSVSTERNRGRVSGLGVAVGYVGSFIGLGIGRLVFDVLDGGYPSTFRSLAGAFLLFALPVFFLVPEEGTPSAPPGSLGPVVRLLAAWRGAATQPGLLRFLISRFLYTDAINTLIGGFLALFAITELGLRTNQVDLLLGLAILSAIGGGLGTGRLVQAVGPTRALRSVMLAWALALALGITAAVSGLTGLVWVVGLLGGAALGGTWTADRVLMVRLSPPERLGEFYGLYATVGRFATIVGPLVWALVVDVLGWGRSAALGALGLFILAAWWSLRRLPEAA